MTGETGAGKSIIVDALSACLGGRVGTDMVRHGSSNAEVEAVFSTEDFTPDMVAELAAQGLEADENVLILSRDIQAAGRGVARVNGRAAVVATLGLLAERLVDLHGQSEHLSLLKPARQLDLLDHFAGLD